MSANSQSPLDRLMQHLLHPWVALAWLGVMLVAGVWVFWSLSSGRSFDTSVLALLPEDRGQSPAEQRAQQQLSDFANQRLVFIVSHDNRDTSLEAAAIFQRSLERSEVFATVQGEIGETQLSQWRDFFFPYRYGLLTSADRQRLAQGPVTAEHPLVERALSRLYSPLAATLGDTLVEDPLQLFFEWQLTSRPRSAFQLEDNWLTRQTQGRHHRLLTVELLDDPYHMAYQQQVLRALRRATDDLPVGADVLRSGLLIHAAHGADQAQQEVSTIGIGSLAGITLLLLYFFRRLRFLAVALFPIAVGCLFALAVCLWVFTKLHLITLAFGAGLVGVAIDYSLHYLCAQRDHRRGRTPSGRRTLARIFPGITLGLVSSVLAYAAQGAAPFPGLRQMAVFSACGLLGAWLTVVCWLPRLRLPKSNPQGPRAMPMGFVNGLGYLLEHWPCVRRWPVAGVLALMLALAVWQVWQLPVDDSVRRLQTSSPALLAEESQVQQLTRGITGSQYFLLSADNEQTLLQLAETIEPTLAGWVNEGVLYDYQSPARFLPSLARQQARRQLQAERVYGDQQNGDAGLAAVLADSLGSPSLREAMTAAFDDSEGDWLQVDDWLASPVSDLTRQLWLGQVEEQHHLVVGLAGLRDQETLQRLSDFATMTPGVEFIDHVATITQVLTHHRQQLQRWLVVAYAIVFALLFWRYGLQAWRVVAAPALASVFALGVLGLAGLPVNIFNLLALLLVLGIGLDASIFLRESARNTYTWVAVTLAAMTTLLAFGLLALSATPVLHQFGITVLLGIVFIWLLAPCFVQREPVAEA